jgi:hypothetical protein
MSKPEYIQIQSGIQRIVAQGILSFCKDFLKLLSVLFPTLTPE